MLIGHSCTSSRWFLIAQGIKLSCLNLEEQCPLCVFHSTAALIQHRSPSARQFTPQQLHRQQQSALISVSRATPSPDNYSIINRRNRFSQSRQSCQRFRGNVAFSLTYGGHAALWEKLVMRRQQQRERAGGGLLLQDGVSILQQEVTTCLHFSSLKLILNQLTEERTDWKEIGLIIQTFCHTLCTTIKLNMVVKTPSACEMERHADDNTEDHLKWLWQEILGP